MKLIELSGQTIGNWYVIRRNESKGHPTWVCRCVCGKEKIVSSGNLRSGRSASCGCVHKTKHGMHRHSLYPIWQAMIQRCTNPNAKTFHRYGGRGIKVCDEWLGENGFPQFLCDMGERPKGMTLERKDNDGNYCRDNCTWASRSQQYRNRSTNHFITFNGETLTLTEWADRVGIAMPNLYSRIYIYDWPLERALTQPPNRKYSNRKENAHK